LYELALYEGAEQVIHAAIETFSLDQLHHCIVGMGHLYRDRGDYEHVDICACKHRGDGSSVAGDVPLAYASALPVGSATMVGSTEVER
jgi:hypothetical protein